MVLWRLKLVCKLLTLLVWKNSGRVTRFGTPLPSKDHDDEDGEDDDPHHGWRT